MSSRPIEARNGYWTMAAASGPWSYPATRYSQPPTRMQPSAWTPSVTCNDDYGNLVSQGFGASWQSDVTASSPHSESCCSPPTDGSWISPMDAQPIYLSPSLLHGHDPAHLAPNARHFVPITSPHSSYSDSEEETICARSPDSGPYMTHRHPGHYQQGHVFDMDLDEPSTTTAAGDDEDLEEEETTIDDSEAFDDGDVDDLDTTIDYSWLRGAVDSTREVEDFDVALNASKTPCLDALAFCVVMRLGAYQTYADTQDGSITITNFPKLLTGIHHFCPKKSQTANEEARIKALKRWFEGIPTKRKRDSPFVMRIKDRKNPIVKQIIKKMQRFCIERGYVRASNPTTQQLLHPF